MIAWKRVVVACVWGVLGCLACAPLHAQDTSILDEQVLVRGLVPRLIVLGTPGLLGLGYSISSVSLDGALVPPGLAFAHLGLGAMAALGVRVLVRRPLDRPAGTATLVASTGLLTHGVSSLVAYGRLDDARALRFFAVPTAHGALMTVDGTF